jgi:nucleotide-binding universal stress UspA family protein
VPVDEQAGERGDNAMTVMVAVPDSAEGRHALEAAAAEAQRLGTTLLVVSLSLNPLDVSHLPPHLAVEVLDGSAGSQSDAVLHHLNVRPDVERLVICLRRRSPVGKAFLGSTSQDLLLHSPVPVLAVRIPASG